MKNYPTATKLLTRLEKYEKLNVFEKKNTTKKPDSYLKCFFLKKIQNFPKHFHFDHFGLLLNKKQNTEPFVRAILISLF